MTAPIPPSYYRTLTRLTRAAEREWLALKKALPSQMREAVTAISVRFEDRPSSAMTERGLSDEALSLSDGGGKFVTIFLMNIFERYGKEPGAFNEALRRELMAGVADLTGLEVEPQEA